MNAHTYPVAGASVTSSAADSQSVANSYAKARRASAYAKLLEGPIGSLAGQAMDRPDVQSVAILGYN